MKDVEKSVMIITYDMIPYAQWGACQRMYFLADYLQEHGYSVYVVHAQRSEYLGDYGHPIRFHFIPIISPKITVSSGNNVSMKRDDGGRFANAAVDVVKSIVKSQTFSHLREWFSMNLEWPADVKRQFVENISYSKKLHGGREATGIPHGNCGGYSTGKSNRNRIRSRGCCAPKRNVPSAIAPWGFSSVEPVAELGLIRRFHTKR